MTKRVWILGAGFSRPLGGPLLHELFTNASRDRLRWYFPPGPYERLWNEAAECAREMYRLGVEESLWGNPEQFLDELDLAAEEPEPSNTRDKSPKFNFISDKISRASGHTDPPSVRFVSGAAKRIFAAECSAFLTGGDPSGSERWQPFREWAKKLNSSDTIVTFNYDRVCELLAKHANPRIRVVLPGSPVEDDAVRVLKLHGSVDWKRLAGGYQFDDPDFALMARGDQLAIGTPGPSKLSRSRELGPLWQLATDAIAVATEICFIGYRFPDTDAHARRELLGAMRRNKTGLEVYTCLGDTNSYASRRLKAIIEAASQAHVIPVPMYSQDLLDVFGLSGSLKFNVDRA